MRLTDRLILTLHSLARVIQTPTHELHLTTDPTCRRYVEPRYRTWLDRASRGESCTPCMRARAFGALAPFIVPKPTDYDTHCPTCDAPEPTHTPTCAVQGPTDSEACTCHGRGRPCYVCAVARPTDIES